MTPDVPSILSVLWALSVVACGHGELPATGDIVVRANACSHDLDMVELGATIEVGLENDQAIRVTFLPGLDGVQFSRTTTWSCGAWSVLDGDRGCGRDLGQPEIRQVVTVAQLNTVDVGTLPARFEFTMVASITDAVAPTLDLENVILTNECN